VNRAEHQIGNLAITLAERLVDDFLMENSMTTAGPHDRGTDDELQTFPTVIRGNGSHGVGGRASELPIITIAVVQHAACTCSVGVLQRLVGAADHGPRPRLECFVGLRTEPVVLVACDGEHERIDR
jgi:hypothetical protein